MEDKDPTVGFKIKQFLTMWGQAAGTMALIILALLGVFCVFIGVVTLLKIAGLLVGSILCFVIATLGITIWGWMDGERP